MKFIKNNWKFLANTLVLGIAYGVTSFWLLGLWLFFSLGYLMVKVFNIDLPFLK